ncbi:MAG TPA: (5-formylfuran-3-yl)methyl phosphate synthase [Xanthobacteraceae bacterium]|jgi:FolB domain-containing protein|nr:(5-formylfuran-3-yl)methyl phosphate synthase [Xanthobacteraceae bacterium]
MTLLLASVTGPDEAAVALAHGADIIDLKDASRGALGALDPDVLRATVAAVSGRRPVSAVTGDLPMEPDVIAAAVTRTAETKVDYVKVGLFPGPRRQDCIRALAPLAQTTKIVGVMFADRSADNDLIKLMAEAGFAGAMLDTADKRAGRLIDCMDVAALRVFVGACREHGLMAGLAGSLEAPDVPRLLLLEPDYLGFRGALCVGRDRTARIDPAAIAIIRELIPLDARSAADEGTATRVDYRLLAARGYSLEDSGDGATDHIFVRDFVLPARIGAYAREREKPQSVRFNVDAKVRRIGHGVEDMRDVFSYDVITDGIRIIVAQEHIAFLETLAERVAASVLGHPRVVSVTVRVEKLDVGPGAVGVEIVRDRPADVARVHHLYPAATRQPKAAE